MSKLRLRTLNSINVSTHNKHYDFNCKTLNTTWKQFLTCSTVLNNQNNIKYFYVNKPFFNQNNKISNAKNVLFAYNIKNINKNKKYAYVHKQITNKNNCVYLNFINIRSNIKIYMYTIMSNKFNIHLKKIKKVFIKKYVKFCIIKYI